MLQKKHIIILIFTIWIFGMAIISAIMPKQAFSQMENRYLAEFPVVSLGNIVDGSFEDGFEAYLNDHFVMRDFFVRLSKMKTYMLGIRKFGDVYYAKGDTLLRALSWNPERATKNTKAITAFAEQATVPVDIALIPGAVDIWSEYLPDHAPNYDQEIIIQDIYDELTNIVNPEIDNGTYVNHIDLYSELKAHAEEAIYYHTDHHWTSLGAYYGYAAYQTDLGRSVKPIVEYEDRLLSTDFYGTLYSDVPLSWIKPDELHAYASDEGIEVTVFDGTSDQKGELYCMEHLQEKNQYPVFLGGNQPIVKITNSKGQDGRLLIVRDSYVDSLAPFLAQDYRELYLIDPRYYRKSLSTYIEEHDIDRVLICMSLASYSESTGLPVILH